jgi:Na+/H+ antiporter NhaD/arsenite permease-like protein
MNPTLYEMIATLCLGCTLIHTFSASFFARFKNPYLHLLSEVEVVFALWGALYFMTRIILVRADQAIAWIQHLSMAEPVFVVAIMLIASTQPVLNLAENCITLISQKLRIPLLPTLMTVGPLLGSLITEPAAMTVSALILNQRILGSSPSKKLLYSSLAVLFVNVSIGGVLTSFAAPPVLMVAHAWNWDTPFMLSHFGIKSAIALILNSAWLTRLNRDELAALALRNSETESHAATPKNANPFVTGINLMFLIAIVVCAHHPHELLPLFGALVIYFKLTRHAQGQTQWKPALMVGGFLAGLAVLTVDQGWWLKPALLSLEKNLLFIGATLLTAITDNAALTSLAARVPELPEDFRYFVVAGAVSGGGLTLIANAPNPAGFSILKSRFGAQGLNPKTLLIYAITPTLIAGGLLWIHF